MAEKDLTRAEEQALLAEADYWEAVTRGDGYDEIDDSTPTIHELTRVKKNG